MINNDEKQRLQKTLASLLRDTTPLQAALAIAEAMREVYKGEWKVKYEGNTFTIEAVK